MTKTWLEENYSINNSPYTDFTCLFCRHAIEKVCKKILEEVDELRTSRQIETGEFSVEFKKKDIENIIRKLGVKV